MTLRDRAVGIVASVAFIAIVWVLLDLWIAPEVTPTIPEVARQIWNDRTFYWPHIKTTLAEAAWGWLWGNLAAVVVGSLIVLVRPVAPVLERLTVVVYAVPLLAVGPILQIITQGATTKIALAALAVFFTTTVTWTLGLRSADRAALDVVATAGGGRLTRFRKVRMHSALPYLFAGLQIAAPAAVLGAIIGEYLGGSRGLGVAMIQSQSAFNVPRTWGLAVVIAALVGILYFATTLIGRLAVPWAGRETGLAALHLSGADSLKPAWRWVAAAVSAVVIIAAWWGALAVLDLDTYFAYRPGDVLAFLTDPDTADQRSDLWSEAIQTGIDTGVGFSVGLSAAVVAAIAVVASPLLDRIVTPVAVALRSIPIIAMTPLIALVFGRGLGAVTVIVGLVVFFPSLVAVAAAMRNAPAQACELVAAYGGSTLRQISLVRLPLSLPALFAAARIALPGAIGGALLAEWLATGQGLGSLMLRATSSSRFGIVWAGSVLIVAASVACYSLVGAMESVVAKRLGSPGR